MSVTTTLAACSTTPSLNGPDGAVDPPSTLDDSIRYALSFVATLRDTKAALGSNSDITAINGLTTALTVGQGGTGVKTLSGLAYGNGSSAFTAATAAQVLSTIGVTPAANGGTGVSSLTGISYSNGASPHTAATSAQVITAIGYTPVQNGTGTGQVSTNIMKLGWDGSTRVKITVDTVDQGNVAMETSANTFTQAQAGPTPTTGDRSGKFATTQMFANEFSNSIVANGYQKLPSGLIIQWGTLTPTSGQQTVSLPIAFPNNFFTIAAQLSSSDAEFGFVNAFSASLSQYRINVRNSAGTLAALQTRWIAIGN